MRFVLPFAVILGFGPTLRAGLYNPAEPLEGLLQQEFKDFPTAYQEYQKYHQVLQVLRKLSWEKVPLAEENPFRLRHLLMGEFKMDPRKLAKEWTPAQGLSLGAYLIRRKKFPEARNLLDTLRRNDPKNFLLYANLASAYQPTHPESNPAKAKDPVQAANDCTQAIDYLKDALKFWPADWDSLKALEKGKYLAAVEQLGWIDLRESFYRKMESNHLKLLEMRRKELFRARKDKPREDDQKVDALFGDLVFVGDGGEFEPGKLSDKERKKLPRGGAGEALAIVQQLLLWLPDDPRLLWLLAELYNAEGHVVPAQEIFEALAGLSSTIHYRPRQLKLHRQILNEYLKAHPEEYQKIKGKEAGPEEKPGFPWKILAVGMASGAVVMLFLLWQIGEIRRRRWHRAAAALAGPKSAAIAPTSSGPHEQRITTVPPEQRFEPGSGP